MFVFSKGKIRTGKLICDKPNKYAGTTNWGKNTQRGKDGVLKESKKIKPVPEFSPRNNIWRYVVGGGFGQKDEKAYKHPATFPYDLAKDHIITWSEEGDIVLDPFAGSGTTLLASKNNNRNFLGFEIFKEYCDLIDERLNTIKG